MEENQILAEIEGIVGKTSSELRRKDDVATPLGRERNRRRFPLRLFSVFALLAALVPAGLKAGDLLIRVTHY